MFWQAEGDEAGKESLAPRNVLPFLHQQSLDGGEILGACERWLKLEFHNTELETDAVIVSV